MAPDRDLYAALRVARSKRKAVGCVRHMVPSPFNVLFSLSLSKLLSRYLAFSTFFPSNIHFPLKAEREVCTSKSNLACANTAFFFFTQQGSISRPSHLCTFFLKISLLWSFLHSSNMLMLMCTLHGQCRTCSTSHPVRPTSYMLPFPRCTANVVHDSLFCIFPLPFFLKKRRTGGETASFKLKEGVRTALWDPMNPNQFAAATEGKSIP